MICSPSHKKNHNNTYNLIHEQQNSTQYYYFVLLFTLKFVELGIWNKINVEFKKYIVLTCQLLNTICADTPHLCI